LKDPLVESTKFNCWSDFIGYREKKAGKFCGGTATMRRRCDDRKCSCRLAKLNGERRGVVDEVCLELPLNVTCDEV
jgi:hypothetical protein